MQESAVKIFLAHGLVARVSLEDAERIAQYRWHVIQSANGQWYPAAYLPRHGGGSARVLLARVILDSERGEYVAYRDDNTLNCTRPNLFHVTAAQQHAMGAMNSRNKTGYRGVSRYRNGQYVAQIGVQGSREHLGYFPDITEAARAYDAAAYEAYGPVAKLNFPDLLTR